jgi:multimeric flavodoxin WrbA
MKVLILNGNPKTSQDRFDNYLDELAALLHNKQHETTTIVLRDKKINHCIGCYSCWVKTPGVCIFDDSMPEILKAILHADVLLYTSPIIMGFTSGLLKSVQERTLPLIHPFIYIKDDRCQHIQRYETFPAIGLLLGNTNDDNRKYVTLIDNIMRGSKTRNFLFTKTMDVHPQEVADEIDSI